MISGRIILPTLLITTSRKTSNRVRSFARDLSTVLPDTERFNRGGMGRAELAARVSQSGANAALIISMWKGNPGILSFTSSTEEELVTIKIESAKLRREVNPTKKKRVVGTAGVFIKSGSTAKTRELGIILASFLNLEVYEATNLESPLIEDNQSIIWLEDQSSGKILWTHYHSTNGVEIGPRIRITSIRRNE